MVTALEKDWRQERVWKWKWNSLSHVWLFETPWNVAHQVPLSMGFSRQEYCIGLPFPSPGHFLTQDLNPGLLHCRQILYREEFQFSSVQSLSCVRLFATPWATAHQASLSITNSWSLLKFISIAWWCHPTISSSVVPFSFPPSLNISQH